MRIATPHIRRRRFPTPFMRSCAQRHGGFFMCFARRRRCSAMRPTTLRARWTCPRSCCPICARRMCSGCRRGSRGLTMCSTRRGASAWWRSTRTRPVSSSRATMRTPLRRSISRKAIRMRARRRSFASFSRMCGNAASAMRMRTRPSCSPVLTTIPKTSRRPCFCRGSCRRGIRRRTSASSRSTTWRSMRRAFRCLMMNIRQHSTDCIRWRS